MQKIKYLSVILSWFFVALSNAQTNEQSNLKRNTESIHALQELLSTSYSAVSESKTVVPSNTFVWSNTLVFNSFGDESAQIQAKTMETEFGNTFNGSSWKFQALDLVNGSQTMNIITQSGENQTANFSCSGAQFTSGNLIQGIEFQAYLFQSKSNAKEYIILFSISNGMTIVADFVKQ